MQQIKNKIFEKSSVPKAVFFNTVPAICSMIMVMIYNLADTFFVGRMGNPYMVAAVSYVLPIFMIPSAIGNLFGIGGTSVISVLWVEVIRNTLKKYLHSAFGQILR